MCSEGAALPQPGPGPSFPTQAPCRYPQQQPILPGGALGQKWDPSPQAQMYPFSAPQNGSRLAAALSSPLPRLIQD